MIREACPWRVLPPPAAGDSRARTPRWRPGSSAARRARPGPA